MAKKLSLCEELSKRIQSGKVEFLTHKAEIKEALESGHRKKDIWQQLQKQDRMPVSYQMFVRYIDQFIGKTKTKPESPLEEIDSDPNHMEKWRKKIAEDLCS